MRDRAEAIRVLRDKNSPTSLPQSREGRRSAREAAAEDAGLTPKQAKTRAHRMRSFGEIGIDGGAARR